MKKHESSRDLSVPRGEKYLTLREVSAKLGHRSRSAIYLDIAAGRLPKPIKLGGRVYWAEGALDAFLRASAE